MAKVSMYRGIDPNDGKDSLIAVSEGRVAPTWYTSDSQWLAPETFGKFKYWSSGHGYDDDQSIIDALPTMELIWEADL